MNYIEKHQQHAKTDKSEYEAILNLLINLKQGKAEAYSELVEKAM